MEAVRRWRLEQEESISADRRLGRAAVERFVQHFERITLSMMTSLPGRADVTVDLDASHSISSLSIRGEEGSNRESLDSNPT